jgi:hypothetical protein
MRAFAVAVLALVAGCDLFHPVEDLPSACDLDPLTPGCPEAECTSDPGRALARAEKVCAWLAACESPLGQNRYTNCIDDALRAYDCARGMGYRGAAREVWTCLARAEGCGAIARCVHPAGAQVCNVTLVGCGDAEHRGRTNANTRVDCREAGRPASGESCAARGKTCGGDRCVGSSTPCTRSRCDGTRLVHCKEGKDEGIDCASVGAGRCVENEVGAACVPSQGAACSPTRRIECDGDVAVACAAGVEERVRCREGCSPTTGWQASDACALACAGDACEGGVLSSCGRRLDCASVGLGPCRMVSTADGERAACSTR